MKKTILSICVLILFACQNPDKPVAGNATAFDPANPLSATYSNNKLNIYRDYILQLDSTEVNNSTKAAHKFNELFKGEAAISCDTAFAIFHSFYLHLDKILNEIHQKDTSLKYDSIFIVYDTGPKPVLSKAITDYQHALQSNGFEIGMEEGMTYIKQDRDFIARHFYALVSEAMKTYLTKLNIENKEGITSDGGLVISPTRLADKIIWMESFMTNNPDFMFTYKLKEDKIYYQTVLFTGIDNTPLYTDRGTKKLSGHYIDAYEHLLNQYPNTQLSQIVRPYYQALKKGQTVEAHSLLDQYGKSGFILPGSREN